jgi:hypothetical protein
MVLLFWVSGSERVSDTFFEALILSVLLNPGRKVSIITTYILGGGKRDSISGQVASAQVEIPACPAIFLQSLLTRLKRGGILAVG